MSSTTYEQPSDRTLDTTFDALYCRLRRSVPPNKLPALLHDELQNVVRRSVDTAYVPARLRQLAEYRKQVEALKALPVVEQRTPVWYAMRDTMLTASDLAQALNRGKFGNQRQLLIKKAGYEPQPFNYSAPPLKWGTMYEPVANAIYEHVTGTHVHEFGLLPHPTIEWFGCSPDGVTDQGVMLEIKCPYRRLINGEVLQQYYYQIQGQLEVCGLEECDFFECEIKEYGSCAEYEQDATPFRYRGVVLERRARGGEGFEYRYSPFGLNAADTVAWIELQDDFDFTVVHYWYLHKFNINRVYKDPEFVRTALAEAAPVWERVLEFRKDRKAYDDYVAATGKAPKSSAADQAPPKVVKATLPMYAFLD